MSAVLGIALISTLLGLMCCEAWWLRGDQVDKHNGLAGLLAGLIGGVAWVAFLDILNAGIR